MTLSDRKPWAARSPKKAFYSEGNYSVSETGFIVPNNRNLTTFLPKSACHFGVTQAMGKKSGLQADRISNLYVYAARPDMKSSNARGYSSDPSSALDPPHIQNVQTGYDNVDETSSLKGEISDERDISPSKVHPNKQGLPGDTGMALRWAEVVPSGQLPSARYGHSAVGINNSQILVFGGWGFDAQQRGEGHLSDLYILATDTMQWVRISASGQPPPARYGHVTLLTADQRRMIVFGGWGPGVLLNDTWFLDVESARWSQAQVRGPVPPGRAHHAGCMVGNKLWVFGGYDGKAYLNDVHMLDVDTLEWSQPRLVGSGPSPRAGHTLSPLNDHRLAVVGGWNGESVDGDLTNSMYVLDTEKMQFQTEVADGNVPSPRARHTTTATQWGGVRTLVMFGGRDVAKGSASCLSDAICLNTDLMEWKAPFIDGKIPPGRYAHTATLLSRHRLFIFGGWADGEYLNDLHVLEVGVAQIPSSRRAGIPDGSEGAPHSARSKGTADDVIMSGGGKLSSRRKGAGAPEGIVGGLGLGDAGGGGGGGGGGLAAKTEVSRVATDFVLDKLHQLEDEKAELERVFDAYQRLLAKSREEQAEQHRKNQRQQEAIQRLKQDIKRGQDDLKRVGEEEKALQRRLEEELREQQAHSDALRQELREERGARTEAQTELQGLLHEQNQLKDRQKKLEAQQRELEQHLTREKRAAADLEDQLSVTRGQNQGLQNTIAKLQAEKKAQEETVESIRAQLEESRRLSEALKRQLEQERASGYYLQERVAAEAAATEQLRRSLESQLAAKQRVQTQLDRYREDILPKTQRLLDKQRIATNKMQEQVNRAVVEKDNVSQTAEMRERQRLLEAQERVRREREQQRERSVKVEASPRPPVVEIPYSQQYEPQYTQYVAPAPEQQYQQLQQPPQQVSMYPVYTQQHPDISHHHMYNSNNSNNNVFSPSKLPQHSLNNLPPQRTYSDPPPPRPSYAADPRSSLSQPSPYPAASPLRHSKPQAVSSAPQQASRVIDDPFFGEKSGPGPEMSGRMTGHSHPAQCPCCAADGVAG